MAIIPERTNLRESLKKARQSIPENQYQKFSLAICSRLTEIPEFKKSQHIALYWPHNSEPDTRPLFKTIWDAKKNLYLPVLKQPPNKHLNFQSLTELSNLTANRFGIHEPLQGRHIDASSLELVAVPLVGFDDAGNRLGMGGGFYDASFIKNEKNKRPFLVGLAFENQKLKKDDLTPEHWDVPLDAVITEKQIYRFNP